MSMLFPTFKLFTKHGELAGAFQQLETHPTFVKAGRTVVYDQKLTVGTSYNVMITESNGAFKTIPVKYTKDYKHYPIDLQIWICADVEFEYDDAATV